MSEDIKPKSHLLRALERSFGIFLLGATGGFFIGLYRRGSLPHYSLFVGSNCFLAALPCFVIREFVGSHLDDTSASTISGLLGGSLFGGYFLGPKGIAKGAAAFALAGFATERMSEGFEIWRAYKRDQIIAERARKKSVKE